MTVRRNERRRRLMSEEYVSTAIETDQNVTRQDVPVSKTESSRRAYAIGADRGCQLKTTDLFPKQLWVIVLSGIMLLFIVVGLNILNAHAPQWQPYIGNASVQAISLRGPGTLASWMLCVLLLTTGLASLQIFALRQHRCDDYGGTYRIWLIVPPIFFVASVAAIVDFEAIIDHLTSVTQFNSIANESLIPMTIKLSIVALLMVRLLFEIRDSKAAFSMLVIAWLTLAISTVLNTQWAENRVSSHDMAMMYPNAVLISAISLMLAHLFYVRFVYLHAHGEIAVRKHKPTAAKTKTKTKRTRKPAKSKSAPASTTTATSTREKSSKVVSEPKKKKRSLKRAKPTAAAAAESASSTQKTPTQSNQPTQPTTKTTTKSPAQPTTTGASQESSKQKPATMSDFQTLLKKKQAEKAAAAEQAEATSASASEKTLEASEDGAILKMSKAERRRARKAAKAKRRAA